MTDTEKFNDVYLSLEIRKSAEEKTDAFGNYLFEVEASNENVDLQDQIVLQNALMESKDEFLKGGVISYDHLHKRKDAKGNVISDPSMVIGEPVDVKFDPITKKTIVVGKLYSTNDKAKEIIKMLKAGSTRVRASVGGIFPEIVKNVKTGVEKITHVLWNDLALTTSPVNNTVGSAVFAKSLTSAQFVQALPIEIKKSLYAGYGTDSSSITGGRCLIPEDVGTKVVNVVENSLTDLQLNDLTRNVINMLKEGKIAGEESAVSYLCDNGLDLEVAWRIVHEIINYGGQMMKKSKSFSGAVFTLLKSLTGQAEDDNEEIEVVDEEDSVSDEKEDEADEEESEDEDLEVDEEDSDEEEDLDDDSVEKSECNEVDGTEVLKSLDYELEEMRKSMKELHKMSKDLGQAVVSLAEMVSVLGNEKIPPKSTLVKSLNSNTVQKSVTPKGRPTEDDLYRAQCVLSDAVKEGKIDIRKSSMISSDMQKCMLTGKPMNPEYYEFLQKELNAKEAK